MLKKFIFCLVFLNALNVWADSTPNNSKQILLIVNEQNGRSLTAQIMEKWNQLNHALMAPLRQYYQKKALQQAHIPHSDSDKNAAENASLRLTEFFLRECN